jgi:hypothetical protein
MTKDRKHPITKKMAIDGLNGFVSAEVQNSTFVL